MSAGLSFAHTRKNGDSASSSNVKSIEKTITFPSKTLKIKAHTKLYYSNVSTKKIERFLYLIDVELDCDQSYVEYENTWLNPDTRWYFNQGILGHISADQ